MESALDVLSRAATMVQDNANETRLTSKELPTAAWRRERRLQTGEYHQLHHHPLSGSSTRSMRTSSPSTSPPPIAHVQQSPICSGTAINTNTNIRSTAHHLSIMMAAAASMCPQSTSTNHSSSSPSHCNLAAQINFAHIPHSQALQQINSTQNDDGPLDMSVGNLKQRNSPPPPYREPLPGSQFTPSLARPSVITQAPPKRDVRESILVTSRENDNHSCESIDEHFRRSLGNDYFSLFSKRSLASQPTKNTTSQPPLNPQRLMAHVKSSSPKSPTLSEALTLPPQSTLIQPELILPPAYPGNSPSGHHHQNSQQAHQNHILATPKANSILLSPVSLAEQIKVATTPNSPPLPLVVKLNVVQNPQHTHILQKSSAVTPITSPQTPAPTPGVKLGNTSQTHIFNKAGSRTASPLPLQEQSSTVAIISSHLPSLDNFPSSCPRQTPVPNTAAQIPPPTLPAMMRVKIEPGVQNDKLNNPTPPTSPTSTTNNNINSNATSNSSNISSPHSPQTTSFKAIKNSSNTSAEVLASVNDHFAKALGDTWKKLQENSDIRK